MLRECDYGRNRRSVRSRRAQPIGSDLPKFLSGPSARLQLGTGPTTAVRATAFPRDEPLDHHGKTGASSVDPWQISVRRVVIARSCRLGAFIRPRPSYYCRW